MSCRGSLIVGVYEKRGSAALGVLGARAVRLPAVLRDGVAPAGVRVVRGEIWDVVVDVRKTSATFGKWFGVTLNGDDPTMLWIPPGFAHGFLCMSEVADVLYKTSAPWSAEHERTILWDDEELNIDWPTLEANEPILSPKDLEGQPFAEWRTA